MVFPRSGSLTSLGSKKRDTMAESGIRHRNTELAVVLKNDPARLRSRVVETEPRKRMKNRARRKATWKREAERSD